jgi:single-strand DNA-binding protein
MVNKVLLIGRLGADPVAEYTQSQTPYCRFSLATTEKRGGKDGAPSKEETEWHNIIAWDKTAELCSRYLSKGRRVYIEGKLRTSSWEKNGQKQYKTEIVANNVQFLDSATQKEQPTPSMPVRQPVHRNQKSQPPAGDDLNSIPF